MSVRDASPPIVLIRSTSPGHAEFVLRRDGHTEVVPLSWGALLNLNTQIAHILSAWPVELERVAADNESLRAELSRLQNSWRLKETPDTLIQAASEGAG